LLQIRAKTSGGGVTTKAIDYTLTRWPSLIRYADTDHLPIDNNAVENTSLILLLLVRYLVPLCSGIDTSLIDNLRS